MSTQLTLMSLPQEILLMILTFYFSNSSIKVRKPIRRHEYEREAQKIPACISLLFANKILFQIGVQVFYKNTLIDCNMIFKMRGSVRLSWIFYQVPWDRIRFISGDDIFADCLDEAVSEELLSIQHLHGIKIRSKDAFDVQSSYRPVRETIDHLAKSCQASAIGFQNFLHVDLLDYTSNFYFTKAVGELKCVLTADLSIEIYEARILNVNDYERNRESIEKAWGCDLPKLVATDAVEARYRSSSVKWSD